MKMKLTVTVPVRLRAQAPERWNDDAEIYGHVGSLPSSRWNCQRPIVSKDGQKRTPDLEKHLTPPGTLGGGG